jgi:hypothetical protein
MYVYEQKLDSYHRIEIMQHIYQDLRVQFLSSLVNKIALSPDYPAALRVQMTQESFFLVINKLINDYKDELEKIVSHIFIPWRLCW